MPHAYAIATTTTEEALKIREIDFAGSAGVHHLTFARPRVPEPAGFSDCPVLFKATWLAMLSAGAGAIPGTSINRRSKAST